MSDKNITACVSCDQPFGFVFHRRHQCERCQAWVCSNCSKARAVLWSASTTSSNKNRHPASSRICVHCRCELYARRRGLAIDGVLQSYLAEYLLAQEYDKAKPPMTEGGSTNTIGPLDAPRECVPCKDKGTDDHGGEGNNGNNNNSNNIWSKPTGRSNTATNGNVCVVGPDANGHDTNHACTCVPTCMCSVRLLGKAHFRSELQGISLVLEQLERELSGFMPPARESPTTPPCPYHQPKPQPHEDKKESPSVEQQAAAEAEKGIQLQALMQKMNDLSFQAAQVTDKLAHLRVEDGFVAIVSQPLAYREGLSSATIQDYHLDVDISKDDDQLQSASAFLLGRRSGKSRRPPQLQNHQQLPLPADEADLDPARCRLFILTPPPSNLIALSHFIVPRPILGCSTSASAGESADAQDARTDDKCDDSTSQSNISEYDDAAGGNTESFPLSRSPQRAVLHYLRKCLVRTAPQRRTPFPMHLHSQPIGSEQLCNYSGGTEIKDVLDSNTATKTPAPAPTPAPTPAPASSSSSPLSAVASSDLHRLKFDFICPVEDLESVVPVSFLIQLKSIVEKSTSDKKADKKCADRNQKVQVNTKNQKCATYADPNKDSVDSQKDAVHLSQDLHNGVDTAVLAKEKEIKAEEPPVPKAIGYEGMVLSWKRKARWAHDYNNARHHQYVNSNVHFISKDRDIDTEVPSLGLDRLVDGHDRIQKLVSSTHHHHGVSQRPHTPDQDRHQSSEFAGGGRLEELGEHYGMNDANVFQSKATNTTLFVVDILPRGVLSTEIHDQASSAACVSSSSSLLSSSSPSSSSPIIGSESNPNPPHTQARDHRHRQLEKQKEVLDTFKLYTHLSEQRVKQQRSAMRKLYLQMQEKVEWNNGKHEQLLRRLWCLSRPDIDFPGHVSERWKDIGFQGRDPVTDFRGMGSLALHSLVYMATHHPRMTRFLVNEQSLREFEYPLCCAVINIVDKLASLLHLKEAFSTPHQHQQKRRPQEEESHKHERIQVSKPQSSPRRPPPPPGRLTTSPSSPAALSSISIQSPSSSSPLSSPPPRTRNAHNKAAPDSALSPSFTASLSSPSAGGRFALSSIFRSMFRSDHKSASPLSSAQTSPTTSPFRLHRPPPPPRQSDGSDSKEHFKQTEKETHRGNRTDLRPASASLSSSSSPSPALSSYALQRQRVETMLSSPLFQLFCRSLREDGEAQKGKKNKGTKIEKTCHHCYSALLADNEAMGVTRDDKVNCTSSSPLPSSSSVLPSACLYTCSVPGVTRSSLSSLPSSAAAGAPKRDLLTASGQDNNEDLSYDIVGAQAVLTASFHPCNGTVENEDNGGNRRAGEPHPPSSPPPPLCYHKAKNDNPLHYCLLEGGLKNIRSKVSLSTSFSSPSYYYFLYDMCQGVDGWEREIGVDPTFQDQNKGEKDDGGTSPPFQPFHELVCALISLLDVLWVRQRASYMQFPMVLRQVEQHLQHQIKAEPLSFETLIYRLSLTAYTLGQEQGQK